MRDLTSVEEMLPDLQNKLAFMYYTTVEKSKHLIEVDRTDYKKAEAHLNIIPILLECEPDVEEVNYHLNEFLKYIETCCLPEVCEPDVVELQCETDGDNPTYWIPDGIACEVTTTTTTTSTTTTTTAAPTVYEMYATVTSFDDPDLVGYFPPNIVNVEIILKAEVDDDKQFILVEDTLPRTLIDIYYYSYALGIYIVENKLSDFTYSNPTGFKKYLYNGAKRGTIKVKLVFG